MKNNIGNRVDTEGADHNVTVALLTMHVGYTDSRWMFAQQSKTKHARDCQLVRGAKLEIPDHTVRQIPDETVQDNPHY